MSTKDQKPVIRYSKEVMIALHDSPLVQKPESMPSLLVWFGEDPDSPTCKNILNGSYMTRPTSDRGIILGPTKTNFASSLYGGLKKSDDNSSKSQSLNNSRHRQLDDRTNVNGIRSPRGPSYIGEKGFSHRSLDNKPPSDRKYMGSSPPHNKQRNDRYYNGDMKNNNNNRRDSHKNRHYNTSNNNYQDSDSSERIPEWMDYTPEVEQETKDEQDTQAQFANDLEAWKSNMKKRDGIQDEPTTKVEDSFATLSLEPQQPPPQDPLSFFEEGLNETRRDQKGGSRFAKFFAKRETPTTAVVEVKPQPPPQQQQQQTQGRSISVTDLFGQQSQQQQQANKDSSINLMNMIKQEPQQQQQVTSPTTSNNVRVFSEEDVLKSLGANKKPVEDNRSNEDVIGFNRVLQILSQPKPMLQSNNENSPPRVQQKGSPMMTGSPMVQQHTETKPTTSRFGNNLPTSVLRQMSARSSEGKASPSLKSTPPPQHNIHPQQQQQHLPPLPPHYMGYHQPMYSPGHPAMMDPRAFEQFVHGMPPPHMMMMPPLPPGQRPMMTPPPHLQQLPMPMQGQQRFPLQQQQQQQQQMPPHMTNGIPPQLFNKNQGWEQR